MLSQVSKIVVFFNNSGYLFKVRLQGVSNDIFETLSYLSNRIFYY